MNCWNWLGLGPLGEVMVMIDLTSGGLRTILELGLEILGRLSAVHQFMNLGEALESLGYIQWSNERVQVDL